MLTLTKLKTLTWFYVISEIKGFSSPPGTLLLFVKLLFKYHINFYKNWQCQLKY